MGRREQARLAEASRTEWVSREAMMDLHKKAEEMEALILELIPQRDAAKDKREKKALSGRIKTARMLVKWVKSRAGYVPTSTPTAL
jgi:hypothetical protein